MATKGKIVGYVFFTHFLVVASAALSAHFTKTVEKKTAIQVRTVRYEEPKIEITPRQVTQPKTVTQKVVTRPQKKKSPKPKSVPAKHSRAVKTAKLLSEIEKSFAKIETPSHQKKPSSKETLNVPKKVGALQVETAVKSAREGSQKKGGAVEFRSELVHQLQEALNLPDFGVVKIQIVLDQSGHVATMHVMESESEENRKYLEQMLPSFYFPHQKLLHMDESQRTITVRFCNEI